MQKRKSFFDNFHFFPFTYHTIRKVKFLSKNSISTKLYNFSREIKVEFLDKKWRFRTVCLHSSILLHKKDDLKSVDDTFSYTISYSVLHSSRRGTCSKALCKANIELFIFAFALALSAARDALCWKKDNRPLLLPMTGLMCWRSRPKMRRGRNRGSHSRQGSRS